MEDYTPVVLMPLTRQPRQNGVDFHLGRHTNGTKIIITLKKLEFRNTS